MPVSDDTSQPSVAIVDYGLGNLFSVKHACDSVGIEATITSSPTFLVCPPSRPMMP